MIEFKDHPRRKPHKYEGILQLYFETGMECMGTIFHDNRGNSVGPKWDKPEETMTYRTLDWSIWFGNRLCLYFVKIYNKRNKVVYQGTLTKDRHRMAKEKYRYGFLPKELTTKRWIGYCQKEYRAEVWTNEIATAIKQQYKLDFDIGDMVVDDLTGKDAVVMGVSLDPDITKPIGYWVNGDYLEGGRHPWEISKIDWKARLKKEIEEEKAKNENSNN